MELMLNDGTIALIDDEDFRPVFKFLHWYNDKGYVRSLTSLHRVILESPKNLLVDHINGNPLDNRKQNLRIVDQQKNIFNKRKTNHPRTSIYKGVCWDNSRNKWRSAIVLNGKQYHLGRFTNEEDAAQTYDKKAIEFFGEYASLNFPIKTSLITDKKYTTVKIKDKFILVDEEDLWKLEGLKWTFFNNYVVVHQRLHQLILNCPENYLIDHINRNPLDNRKFNLRITTYSQNNVNKEKRKNCSSKYKGVYWHKKYKKWVVNISYNKKMKRIGTFTNEIDAAKAYDEEALRIFGTFAKLNF